MLGAVGHALAVAGSMTWEILWALLLGFALSAAVQAVVRRSTIMSLIGDERPRTLALAAGLGPRRRRARMPRWPWPAPCFARARTSPQATIVNTAAHARDALPAALQTFTQRRPPAWHRLAGNRPRPGDFGYIERAPSMTEAS
jgi:hypothetical protein